MSHAHPHHGRPVRMAGALLNEARAAVIMLHGRGADAADILALADELVAPHTIFSAPEAANQRWYPNSFLKSLEENEPHLSSALTIVDELMRTFEKAGIPASQTMLLGFSQGACLASEYAARHARRYGGIAVLSGGLIGLPNSPRNYPGSFDGTPVFLGCSDHDPYIPAERVLETEQVFSRLGASITCRLYSHMGHTIDPDEIIEVQRMLSALTS